jgi:hypothetical protein
MAGKVCINPAFKDRIAVSVSSGHDGFIEGLAIAYGLAVAGMRW